MSAEDGGALAPELLPEERAVEDVVCIGAGASPAGAE